jgi:hypothetical protein
MKGTCRYFTRRPTEGNEKTSRNITSAKLGKNAIAFKQIFLVAPTNIIIR